MKGCSFDGCDRKHAGKGYCGGHYQQFNSGKELKPLKHRRPKRDVHREIAAGVLTCLGCDRQLPLDSYAPNTKGKMGIRSRCRECECDRLLGIRYGLSRGAWNRLLELQGGCCAICRDMPGEQGFVVDHDHRCCPGVYTCGMCVRSLLCSKCNFAVGHLETHPDIMAAVEYVQRNHVQLPERYFESAANHYGWLRIVGE